MSENLKEITTVSKDVGSALMVTSFLALGMLAASLTIKHYNNRSVDEIYADITQFQKCDLVMGKIPHGKFYREGKMLECDLTVAQQNDKVLNEKALELRHDLQKEVIDLLPSKLEALEAKMANKNTINLAEKVQQVRDQSVQAQPLVTAKLSK